MPGPQYDLTKEEQVQELIKNLGIEYRFECYGEKRPDGCHRLGDYMEAIKRDFAKAAKVYKLACDEHKFGKSCHKYGNYLLLGKGGVSKNPVEALDYYKKGCEYKCKDSCYQIAGLLTSKKYGLTKDQKTALKYYELACELDDGEACLCASSLYFEGAPGITKDLNKAFVRSFKGCQLGSLYSCANVAMMYDKGLGVTQNVEQAKEFKAKALDMQKQMKENQHELKFGEGRKF